uniref:Uncharacterized protein n=1 Tax=Arion vulgaris TaxID=1028688 RepID=A0A0B7BUU7_9EUPU
MCRSATTLYIIIVNSVQEVQHDNQHTKDRDRENYAEFQPKQTIQIDNTRVKQVSEFKYLGSIFTEDGKLDREIETRCQKANAVTYQLAPLLQHPKIKMEVKRQMIKSIILPSLCEQC